MTDPPDLPNKRLLRVDEVANFFSVTERTIRLWITHGYLETEKIIGTVRILRDSVLKCRIKVKRNIKVYNENPKIT